MPDKKEYSHTVPRTIGYALGGGYIGTAITPFTPKGRVAYKAYAAMRALSKDPVTRPTLDYILKANKLTPAKIIRVTKLLTARNAAIGALLGGAFGYGTSKLMEPAMISKKAEYIFEKTAKTNRTVKDMVVGAGAGAAATLATMPFENIQIIQTTMPKQPIRNIIKTMYKSEGLPVFYKGTGVKLLKVIPAAAITYATYKILDKALNNKK